MIPTCHQRILFCRSSEKQHPQTCRCLALLNIICSDMPRDVHIQPGRTSSLQFQNVSRGLWKILFEDVLPENETQKLSPSLRRTDSEVYIAVETPPQFWSCWMKDAGKTWKHEESIFVYRRGVSVCLHENVFLCRSSRSTHLMTPCAQWCCNSYQHLPQ